MISGPLTLPPAGVMKMSPFPLFAPCFSTMTAGALARADAPDVEIRDAVVASRFEGGFTAGQARAALNPLLG